MCVKPNEVWHGCLYRTGLLRGASSVLVPGQSVRGLKLPQSAAGVAWKCCGKHYYNSG